MKNFKDALKDFFFAEDDDLEDYQAPRKKEKHQEVTPVQETPFVPIALNEEIKKPEPVVYQPPVTKKTDEEIIEKPVEKPAKPAYVFTKVISPVYGLKDDQSGYVPPVLTVPVTNTKSPLGTIISPVNGYMEEEASKNVVPEELAALNVSDLLETPKPPVEEKPIEQPKSTMPENLSFFDQEEQ